MRRSTTGSAARPARGRRRARQRRRPRPAGVPLPTVLRTGRWSWRSASRAAAASPSPPIKQVWLGKAAHAARAQRVVGADGVVMVARHQPRIGRARRQDHHRHRRGHLLPCQRWRPRTHHVSPRPRQATGPLQGLVQEKIRQPCPKTAHITPSGERESSNFRGEGRDTSRGQRQPARVPWAPLGGAPGPGPLAAASGPPPGRRWCCERVLTRAARRRYWFNLALRGSRGSPPDVALGANPAQDRGSPPAADATGRSPRRSARPGPAAPAPAPSTPTPQADTSPGDPDSPRAPPPP